MFSFPGVHGTRSRHADMIQKTGFRHGEAVETYARMFGRGVYMFLDDEHGYGRDYAITWALHKIYKDGPVDERACYLTLTVVCEADDVIEWTAALEDKYRKWFERNYEEIKDEYLKRYSAAPQRLRLMNEWRMRHITGLKKEWGSQMKVIVAEMPLSREKKQRVLKYPGCVVKDLEILPAPPYGRKDHDEV